MMIDFPDSPWFKNYYPKTQKVSKVISELERISKFDCTCKSVWTYNKCDSCQAKSYLEYIENEISRDGITEVLERNKVKKRYR